MATTRDIPGSGAVAAGAAAAPPSEPPAWTRRSQRLRPDTTMKSAADLRKFGFVIAVPLAAIGGYLLWRGRPAGYWFMAAAALFLVTALAVPAALRQVEYYWMRFAGVLSVIMTYVILTLTYFLVITPMGLLLRVLGKDLLQLELDRSRTSYWEPVDQSGPASRIHTPF